MKDRDEEILALHRKLAAETLRADQGWERYASANAERYALRRDFVAREKREAMPYTPQDIIDFIGSNYSTMQNLGEDLQPLALPDVHYSLSVHDLQTAFREWQA